MKVIIAGSRTIISYERVRSAVIDSGFIITEVVSGGCRGVDQLGESWAFHNGIEFVTFEANWKKFGSRAGPIRNRQMAEYVGNTGGLVLVWDGVSNGSKSMLEIAEESKLQIYQSIVRSG